MYVHRLPAEELCMCILMILNRAGGPPLGGCITGLSPTPMAGLGTKRFEVGLEVGTSSEVEVELGLEPIPMILHIGVCVVGPLPLPYGHTPCPTGGTGLCSRLTCPDVLPIYSIYPGLTVVVFPSRSVR